MLTRSRLYFNSVDEIGSEWSDAGGGLLVATAHGAERQVAVAALLHLRSESSVSGPE